MALRPTEHVLRHAGWNSRGWGVGSVQTTRKWTRTKRHPQERQRGQWDCGTIVWEQGPQKTNPAIVYDCRRSGERNLGEESPVLFDTVCAELRAHPWLSTAFSSNGRTFFKYSKAPTTGSPKPNPGAHTPRAAVFWKFKGRSKGILQRGDFMKISHYRLFISLWMFT